MPKTRQLTPAELRREAITEAQWQSMTPRCSLTRIMNELKEAGAVRKASSLRTIVIKLLRWQRTL
jgi:hypothetical protein